MADEDWFSANAPPQQPEQDWFAQNSPQPQVAQPEKPSIPALAGRTAWDVIKQVTGLHQPTSLSEIAQEIFPTHFENTLVGGMLGGAKRTFEQGIEAAKTPDFSPEKFAFAGNVVGQAGGQLLGLLGLKAEPAIAKTAPTLAETAGIAKPDIAQPVEPVATDQAAGSIITPDGIEKQVMSPAEVQQRFGPSVSTTSEPVATPEKVQSGEFGKEGYTVVPTEPAPAATEATTGSGIQETGGATTAPLSIEGEVPSAPKLGTLANRYTSGTEARIVEDLFDRKNPDREAAIAQEHDLNTVTKTEADKAAKEVQDYSQWNLQHVRKLPEVVTVYRGGPITSDVVGVTLDKSVAQRNAQRYGYPLDEYKVARKNILADIEAIKPEGFQEKEMLVHPEHLTKTEPNVVSTSPTGETVAPEIPEGAKVTLNVRTPSGKTVPQEFGAKQAEGIFTKEKSSYQALLNCLGA